MKELKPLQIWRNTWWGSDKGFFILLSKDRGYWNVGYCYLLGMCLSNQKLTDNEVFKCEYVCDGLETAKQLVNEDEKV